MDRALLNEPMDINNSNSIEKSPRIDRCVLMFSGGRDSTAAALRLAPICDELQLITITSDHLHGKSVVHQRLDELEKILPTKVHWQMIRQPKNLYADTTTYEPTCLPCHHAYVAVGVKIAQNIRTSNLSFGYVGYQNDWPEQTPHATQMLTKLLQEYGIRLQLPVYSISSKEEVIEILSDAGVSTSALEQKCSQQINNIELLKPTLESEISKWEAMIKSTLNQIEYIDIDCMDERILDTNMGTECGSSI